MSSQASSSSLDQREQLAAIVEQLTKVFDAPSTVVKVSALGQGYRVRVEGASAPEPETAAAAIAQTFSELALPHLETVEVYGWQTGDEFPSWQRVVSLESADSSSAETDNSAVAVSSEPAIAKNAASANSRKRRFRTVKSVLGAVGSTPGKVGTLATQGGAAVSGAVMGTAKAVGGAAAKTGGAIAQSSTGLVEASGKTALSVPEGLNCLINAVGESPELQFLTETLRVDWLLDVLTKVDVVKAEKQVQRLQKKYPQETAAQIARRIMTHKVVYVSGSGMASGLLPGFAAAIVAVDLAANTGIQAEMGYQIACAYGFDVRDEARKGEILAIFGLALGSNQVMKTGLTYVARGIPIAGAAIGAGTNAVALYTVGHAACRFYEAKLQANGEQSDDQPPAPLLADDYVQKAIAQQILMDRILTHVVAAGYPDIARSQLIPELEALNLSPAALEIIKRELDHPTPLETLLADLEPEFATPLLARCQQVVEQDNIVTPAEASVLETITDRLSAATDDADEAEHSRALLQNLANLVTPWRR